MVTPPADPVAAEGLRRRPGGAAAVLIWLLIGAVAGCALTLVATRLRTTPASVTEIRTDPGPPPAPGNEATHVAALLGPSVGTVIAGLSNNRFGEGSGFVVARGSGVSYLETNNHVVDGAGALHVIMPNGRSLPATLVGTDQLDDLAVVSVTVADLPLATFGDSRLLQVGQTVVAIGSPLGNTGSVTEGVISALHRTIQAGAQGGAQTETLQDVLQTDASINLGNSGGPLADSQARVIGVNVAIESSSGASNIGYSIPGNLARAVAEALISHQTVSHPYLGVGYQTSVQAVEAGHGFDGPGVYVETVQTGSPAATAGFRVGDILVAVNGVQIDNGQTLGGLIQTVKVGETVTCTVMRGGQSLTLTATLIERPLPTPTPTP